MKTKVYKIEILVIDHDQLGQAEVVRVIENTKYPNYCINPSVENIRSVDVDWSDDHPLNNSGTSAAAYRDLFPIVNPDI